MKTALTFGRMLTIYIDSLGSRPSGAKYRQIYRQLFEGQPLAQKTAATVTRHEIQLFRQQHESTPSHCRKAMQLICQSYNYALRTVDARTAIPLYDGPNPAAGIRKPSVRSRERVMHRSEIVLLLDSLEFLSAKYQAFFVTRLLTPCRLKELCAMRRDAVDLTTGKWFKQITKNGRPQYTLIPRQALVYLDRLPVDGGYFFMGAGGRPMVREAARKIWGALRQDLRMTDVQLLDFRRTLASYLYTEVKADDLTAKAVLNHYDGRPVAIYTRLNFDQIAALIQQYADWVWALKRTPSEPVPHSLQCPPSGLQSLGLPPQCAQSYAGSYPGLPGVPS